MHVWQAIVHLELGIRESTSNYQFKLLLIRLYCIKGEQSSCSLDCTALKVSSALAISLLIKQVCLSFYPGACSVVVGGLFVVGGLVVVRQVGVWGSTSGQVENHFIK